MTFIALCMVGKNECYPNNIFVCVFLYRQVRHILVSSLAHCCMGHWPWSQRELDGSSPPWGGKGEVPLSMDGFNSASALQDLIRKKITWLPHNQDLRVLTVTFLFFRPPKSTLASISLPEMSEFPLTAAPQ